MARGRFISASISTSRKFEALATNDHRLMYLMLVPHADCEGRHAADTRILGGQVYTLLDLTGAQIETAIRDMKAVGLIRLYEVAGEPFLEVVDFHVHNKVRRDKDGGPTHEAPSRIPPSSDGKEIAATTEQRRSSDVAATAEVEVEVEVQVQDEVQGEELTPTSTSLSASPTHESDQAFVDAWNEHRGPLPAVRTIDEERKRLLKRLRKQHGYEALALFIDATQAVARNDFWIRRRYGFKNLLRGKVLDYAEAWRHDGGRLGEADAKLATQVDRWARALDGVDERPVN